VSSSFNRQLALMYGHAIRAIARPSQSFVCLSCQWKRSVAQKVPHARFNSTGPHSTGKGTTELDGTGVKSTGSDRSADTVLKDTPEAVSIQSAKSDGHGSGKSPAKKSTKLVTPSTIIGTKESDGNKGKSSDADRGIVPESSGDIETANVQIAESNSDGSAGSLVTKQKEESPKLLKKKKKSKKKSPTKGKDTNKSTTDQGAENKEATDPTESSVKKKKKKKKVVDTSANSVEKKRQKKTVSKKIPGDETAHSVNIRKTASFSKKKSTGAFNIGDDPSDSGRTFAEIFSGMKGAFDEKGAPKGSNALYKSIKNAQADVNDGKHFDQRGTIAASIHTLDARSLDITGES
jgi:hypothetical protein